MEIDVLDIRPMTTSATNIIFHQRDMMSSEVEYFESFNSVSCLHALEHFGLGRYGDDIDPEGWQKGLLALTKLTKSGGILYLSVPIGPQRIEFDAHRVFSVETLRNALEFHFDFLEFFYVDDKGNHHQVGMAELSADTKSFGCTYGCGIFILRRNSTPVN